MPPLFINPDNTVTDVSTGLMWYQEITPSKNSWEETKSICANSRKSSYTNWRLPGANELKNLFDKMDSKSNDIFFPTTPTGQFWTSRSSGNSTTIVTIDTETGETISYPNESHYYRAVRDCNHEPSFIQIPVAGGEYKIGSQLNITWDTVSYTNTVDVELSRDGGLTYKMILPSAYRSPLNWIVSQPASPNCQLRIVKNDYSLSNNIHTVGHFSIVDRNAPQISTIFDRSTLPGKQSDSIEYSIDNTDGGAVMIIARSSNPSVVPVENIYLSDRRPAYTKVIPADQLIQKQYFTIQASDTCGQSTITLEVYDSGLLTGQISFNFIVSNPRDALIHLYEQTSGTGWDNRTNWNTNLNICEWEGIICDQSQHVIEINLQNNRLSGSLPVDLANLSDLTILNLSDNYLYGEIPENLYLLRNLKALHLENNHLSGEIPGTLFQFEQMEKLYLNYNQFQGEIPSHIASMTNLVTLNISNNQFSGSFPDGILYLNKLIELDISHNHFNGPIPESLTYLSNLQKLSIASNQFEGNMPEYIQSLSYLTENQSDFRFNMLTTPNDYVAAFMSEKQIDNDWQTSQTLPPTDLKALTATNNMVSFSWEPSGYTADGGYEICCERDGIDKCETISNKAIFKYEFWGLLPSSRYECNIRTITLPHIQNTNRLVSSFSNSITVMTQAPEDIWNIMESPTHKWLNDVWGIPSSRQYIVGDDGVILVYSESEWSSVTSDNTQSLHSIYGFSENDIVSVGADGTILQYNGNKWEKQTPVVNTFLWGLWGSDNIYYAVGAYGTIITKNNGVWQSIDIPTDNDLRDIWGVNNNDIFVVGQKGTIFHFNGSTWSKMDANTQEDLRCVWGFSESNVFAAGLNGTIIHYNGVEWANMNSGIDTHLMDMWGSSTNSLYAVGTQGTIIFYDGSKWQKIYSGTQNYLRGIWGASELFTVGYNGTILRFDTQLPTISKILDQKTNVNIPVKVKFTVGSTMVSPERLRVEALSHNRRLIPWNDEHLQLHGVGNLRELIIKPARDQWGDAKIVITVKSPEGLTSSTAFTINVSSDPLIPYEEREALLALFYQTNGYQWTENHGWTDKWGTECDWYGITCVTDRKNVEKIMLPNNALSGPLPVTLSNLTYLTELDLHGNFLTGELPGSIGKLVKLKEMNLSDNMIAGSLPEEWGSLDKLLLLNLDHNKLEGSIPSTYGNMLYLQAIQLNSNRLCGSIPKEITGIFYMLENQSNFDYNALYSTNNVVSSFMSRIQTNWDEHQSTIPEAVSLTWTAYVISLTWKADTNHTFEVYYSDLPDDNFSKIGPISDSFVKIRGLLPETTYYIKIRKIREPHAYNTNTVYSDFENLSATTASKSDTDSLWDNGNFDEADFYPWEIQDLSTSILFDVIESKTWTEPEFAQFFDILPSDRKYVAVHAGVEGQGTVKLSQNVYIPAGGGNVSFDYRMGWRMSSYATYDRQFNVTITPEGDYTPAEIHTIVSTSSNNEMLDTGWKSMTLDVSAYACQTVKVSFELDYPESVASPMLFVLDNVQLTGKYSNILEIQIPESVQEGDGILTDAGLIKLPKALTQKISLHLISSNDLIMLPDQVMIPSGEKQVTFNIVVSDDTDINGQSYVTVSVDHSDWAACDKQTVLLDNDDIWNQVDTLNTNQNLKRIWGRSDNDIFVLSDRQIIHFNGNSWETQYTQTNGYFQAIWGDNENLYVVGDEGTILSYENSQWISDYTPVTENLTGIWGNDEAVFAAGPYGVLLKKIDDRWMSQSPIISGSMPVVLGGYGQSLYMLSESYVYEYTNGDWISLSLPVMPLLTDIHGSADISPIIVGGEGSILYKHENTWKKSQINMSTHLYGISGKSNALYVVGDHGTILRSESSANALTFYQMNSNSDEKLNDIWASSENNVYAVGNNGTVLRYSGPDVLGFQDAGNFVPGELLTVQNVISFPSNVSALTLSVQIPERLTFKDTTDTNCQLDYDDHTLFFIWSNQIDSPILFNYRLNIPKYIEDIINISARLTYVIADETLEKEMSPSVLVLEKSSKMHTLFIQVSPIDGGHVSGHDLMCPQLCRQTFESSEYIQLQASPESYYSFVKWTDEMNRTISSDPMFALTITQDQTLRAIFRPNEVPLEPIVNYPQNWEIHDTHLMSFELMPFSDPDNDPHQMTKWLIHRADRPHTCAGIFSSNCIQSSSTHLTRYSQYDLISGMQYVWDVGYSDTGSETMVYSDLHRFTIGKRVKIDPIVISSGLDQKDYQMISIPMWLENASAPVAFKDAMNTGYDTRYIKIGKYDPTNNQYVQYNDSMLLLPGVGFWILSRNGMEIPIQGVHVTTTEDIDIPLAYNDKSGNGWNMIGSPTVKNYNWNRLIVIVYNDNHEIITERITIAQYGKDNPYVNSHIWRWNNGVYEENVGNVIIEPFLGYWVEAKKKNVWLRFSVTAQVDKRKRSANQWGIISDSTPPEPMQGFQEKGDISNGCFISIVGD